MWKNTVGCVESAKCVSQSELILRAVAARQIHQHQPAALWPSSRNVLRQRLVIFCGQYYQVLTATHLPILEGLKADLA